MGAPRKNPPANINEIIEQYVAGEGGSTVILGRVIGVSDSTVRKWFDQDEKLKEAYESAREAYMHKLYLELIQMSRAGKGNVAGLIFTLKAKFKQYDMPGSGKLVDVNVNQVQNVMVVRGHGSDEEWAAKAVAQQRALAHENVLTLHLDTPEPAQIAFSEADSDPVEVSVIQHPQRAPMPAFGPPVWHANP